MATAVEKDHARQFQAEVEAWEAQQRAQAAQATTTAAQATTTATAEAPRQSPAREPRPPDFQSTWRLPSTVPPLLASLGVLAVIGVLIAFLALRYKSWFYGIQPSHATTKTYPSSSAAQSQPVPSSASYCNPFDSAINATKDFSKTLTALNERTSEWKGIFPVPNEEVPTEDDALDHSRQAGSNLHLARIALLAIVDSSVALKCSSPTYLDANLRTLWRELTTKLDNAATHLGNMTADLSKCQTKLQGALNDGEEGIAKAHADAHGTFRAHEGKMQEYRELKGKANKARDQLQKSMNDTQHLEEDVTRTQSSLSHLQATFDVINRTASKADNETRFADFFNLLMPALDDAPCEPETSLRLSRKWQERNCPAEPERSR